MSNIPGPRLGIIGSGASAVFLLKHILDHAAELRDQLRELLIFEKNSFAGTGMPYSPLTTDRSNLSNISSVEIPPLLENFAAWLRQQASRDLGEWGIGSATEISEDGIYTRLALGRYLQAQYHGLIACLKSAGFSVTERTSCKICDVRAADPASPVTLVSEEGKEYACDTLVVATGHYFTGEDRPAQGYYASPWPILKLLPEEGTFHDFEIGTLGASLSAFDVVSALAHRHGDFEPVDGGLCYRPLPGTEHFKIVMHSMQGLLPHIQFEQVNAIREIYRHVSREHLLALRDAAGFLKLDDYFDAVGRPLLSRSFAADGLNDMVAKLEDPHFGISELAEELIEQHHYKDPFKGMALELAAAEVKTRAGQPVHWKEALDDLFYTLNFHAGLLPAEDHLRLQKEIMPFVMNVVAAMPLKSARMILALHAAGKLEIQAGEAEVADDADGSCTKVTVTEEGKEGSQRSYRMFVDCSGQKPLTLEEFPFPSLVEAGQVTPARARFANPAAAEELPHELAKRISREDGHVLLDTGGIAIDGAYRLIGHDGSPQDRVRDIASPHVSGMRPYSYGLQACHETAGLVLRSWLEAEHEAPTATA